jgi:RND family efflux transporter MFP subunit
MKKSGALNVIVVVVIISLLGAACREHATTDPQVQITRIKVTRVIRENISFPVRTSGIVIPAREIRLSFKTGGLINALYADAGTKVKKGALLATLDPAEIDAQVSQAASGYEKALRDYTRAKNLFKDSVATLEQLQNAETALNVSKSMLEIAGFNREHSSIIAPDDGVVLHCLVESHEVIGPGYPVFVFGTTGPHWKIKAGMADKDFVRIAYGDSAQVSFDAYPDEKFKAIVTLIGEAANPLTGTYDVELDLLPAGRRLASGFIAAISIIPSRPESYFRIPIGALTEAEDRTGYVFVVSDSSTATKIQVEIAAVYDSWAAIASGLKGNEDLVTEGAAYLTDGEKVIVIEK